MSWSFPGEDDESAEYSMVLLVCKGLEAFRYFSNIVLAEFGGGGIASMKCVISWLYHGSSYLATPEKADPDGSRMRQIPNPKRSPAVW